MRHLISLALLSSAATLGCGEEPLPAGYLELVTGHEAEAWQEPPAPDTVVLEKVFENGQRLELERQKAPAERLSLGTGTPGRYVATALTPDGSEVMRGVSVPIEPRSFTGQALPLFVARTGGFSRPPGSFTTEQGQMPPVALLGQTHLLLLGGQNAEGGVVTETYDLGYWGVAKSSPVLSCPTAPCRFQSVAVANAALLVAVGADWAIWFDMERGTSGDAALPPGLTSYAALAGGKALHAPDGSAWIVGATREGEPTTAVLHIAKDGALSVSHLSQARAGAAATVVPGRGLLVAGGSLDGAGAELLPEGATAWVPLAFPADASVGSAIVPQGLSRVLRLGGTDATGFAPTVSLDLACGSGCALAPVGSPVELLRATAFVAPNDAVLVVGESQGAETRVLHWTPEAIQALPLREPRRGARALQLPTGHIAVVGGELLDRSAANTLELLLW